MNIKNNKTSIKDKPEFCCFKKHQRIPKGNQIDYPEKLGTQGTQNEDKQRKNTPQYVLDTTMRKQTQIT